MTEPIALNDRRELFVDHLLIERLDGASLRLHEPVSAGRALTIERSWEGPGNGPASIFELNGRLHLYYKARTLAPEELNPRLCVALSEDGLSWRRPALGLTPWGDAPDNNMVADEADQPLSGAPWLDERPGVPSDERVKLIASQPISGEAHTAFKDPAGPKRLVFWGSGDGFRFHRLDPQPDLVSDLRNCFDGGNTMFWSEAEQQYVLYYRWLEGEWGRGWRSVARTTSPDLLHWTPSTPMTYGDTPREQFYTNNTQPYFRAPHLYLAPAARFMEGRRVVTDDQVQAIGLHMSQGHFYGNDCSDAVLLTSRAGTTRYDRAFMDTFIRPGPGAGHWTSRTNYPVTGILPDGPDRVMMFVARRYMQDDWHIEKLTLRTDGFASVSTLWAGGAMVTRPFTFTGGRLELNYRTGAAGAMRVELQAADGQPIPDHTLDDCLPVIGDELTRDVVWKAGADVSRLAGRPVRLRVVMNEADLFAIRFR